MLKAFLVKREAKPLDVVIKFPYTKRETVATRATF
jgi:hypothetical protein